MEPNTEVSSYLFVNRVEVLPHAFCSACGREFTVNPMGEKTLVLALGNARRCYFFCATCGDNIVGRVESEDARKRYVWDWTVPIRDHSKAA
jgi:hypothetical protein